MAVYLICPGTPEPTKGAPVKIGFAEDVEQRIRTLQSAHWQELHIVKEWPGCHRSETWMHHRFSAHRIARDWFEFHPIMPHTAPAIFGGLGAVAEIIDIMGGPTAVARALKLPLMTVANWQLRNSIPAKHQCSLLRVADGKVTAHQIVAAHAGRTA